MSRLSEVTTLAASSMLAAIPAAEAACDNNDIAAIDINHDAARFPVIAKRLESPAKFNAFIVETP
ncbi:hypothetical protein [Peristeroidobacter agariperforans]|uniref:hypothetical protein n=1 Tax=Peristeroidobacter agariperforans TaxID=268404 RepID=UPI00101D6440|nr:hypothetical protein [Peristeroidobacter agariperforans]